MTGDGCVVFIRDKRTVPLSSADGTIKRSYKLILPTASARVQGNFLSSVTSTVSSIESISDLFAFVKTTWGRTFLALVGLQLICYTFKK